MFTGLVSAVGTVKSARAADGGRTLVISAPWRGLTLGESVAVDGAGNAFLTGYFSGAVDFGGGPTPTRGGDDV